MAKSTTTTKKISVLQLPNALVRNDGFTLTAADFVLYAVLKHHFYLNGGKLIMELLHKQLMYQANIHDVRTLKKMFGNLYSNGLITEKITSLPKKGPLIIHFVNLSCDTRFTQLPTSLLRKIVDIGHIGYRLLYYYESTIIRSSQSKSFCFASYKEISKTLDFSQVSLSKYNDALVEKNLLKIVKHKIGTEYSYTSNGAISFDKYNNHYYPQINNMA